MPSHSTTPPSDQYTIYLDKQLHIDTKIYCINNDTNLSRLITSYLCDILNYPKHDLDKRKANSQEHHLSSSSGGLEHKEALCPHQKPGGLSSLEHLSGQTSKEQRPDLSYRTSSVPKGQLPSLSDLLSSACGEIVGCSNKPYKPSL